MSTSGGKRSASIAPDVTAASHCLKCDEVIGSGSFVVHYDGSRPYHEGCAQWAECAFCGEDVRGKILLALNAQWHPECLLCKDCDGSLMSGFYSVNESTAVCETCARKRLAQEGRHVVMIGPEGSESAELDASSLLSLPATAKWDYTAQRADELSFRAGDGLIVRAKDRPGRSKGWWVADVHSKRGLVPQNYLQVLEEGSNATTVSQPVPRTLQKSMPQECHSEVHQGSRDGTSSSSPVTSSSSSSSSPVPSSSSTPSSTTQVGAETTSPSNVSTGAPVRATARVVSSVTARQAPKGSGMRSAATARVVKRAPSGSLAATTESPSAGSAQAAPGKSSGATVATHVPVLCSVGSLEEPATVVQVVHVEAATSGSAPSPPPRVHTPSNEPSPEAGAPTSGVPEPWEVSTPVRLRSVAWSDVSVSEQPLATALPGQPATVLMVPTSVPKQHSARKARAAADVAGKRATSVPSDGRCSQERVVFTVGDDGGPRSTPAAPATLHVGTHGTEAMDSDSSEDDHVGEDVYVIRVRGPKKHRRNARVAVLRPPLPRGVYLDVTMHRELDIVLAVEASKRAPRRSRMRSPRKHEPLQTHDDDAEEDEDEVEGLDDMVALLTADLLSMQ